MNQNFTTHNIEREANNGPTMVNPSPHTYATVIEGKAIVLNLESGRYYSLNRTGTALWEQLSDGCSLDSLVHSLGSRGEVSQERVQQDVAMFLENLASEGLIEQTRRA